MLLSRPGGGGGAAPPHGVAARRNALFRALVASAVVALPIGFLARENSRLRGELDDLRQLQRDTTEQWATAYARASRRGAAAAASAAAARGGERSAPPSAAAPAPAAGRAAQAAGCAAQCAAVAAAEQDRHQRQLLAQQRACHAAQRTRVVQCQPCPQPEAHAGFFGGAGLLGGGGGVCDSLIALRSRPVPVLRPRDSVDESALHRNIWLVYGLWDNTEMPPQGRRVVERFKQLNPGWAVRVVGRQEADDFVAKEFPHVAADWKGATPIVRADLLRLLLVLRRGGLYADLDSIFHHSVSVLLASNGFDPARHDGLFFTETTVNGFDMSEGARMPLRNGVPEIATRVANYAFYATAGSAVMENLAALATYRLKRISALAAAGGVTGSDGPHGGYSTLYTAGPDCVTEAVFGGAGTTLLPRVVLVSMTAPKRITNHGMGTWREPSSPWRKTWDSLAAQMPR
eukprot:TRINITY_DN65691_c0_g1_i1.p1 TRINITY_DN65691_c0_g1~~TRINITY_DN65691_c0_g1_i1.p1  ORF type:complete len:486 (+),score=120.74 TRINITY_DN65691_c0_g1_i1:84-1460(+)